MKINSISWSSNYLPSKKKKKLLNRVTMSPSGQLLLNWYSVPDWSVPHPAIFGMCRFFDKHSEENKHCAAGESGVVLALLSGVQGQNPGNFGYFAFWIAQNITLSSATRKIDKSLHQKSTLMSIYRFEFGIPNQYTSFKIALDTTLHI